MCQPWRVSFRQSSLELITLTNLYRHFTRIHSIQCLQSTCAWIDWPEGMAAIEFKRSQFLPFVNYNKWLIDTHSVCVLTMTWQMPDETKGKTKTKANLRSYHPICKGGINMHSFYSTPSDCVYSHARTHTHLRRMHCIPINWATSKCLI